MADSLNVGDVESVLRLRDEFSDIGGKFMSLLGDLVPGLEGLAVGVGLVTTAAAAAVGVIGELGVKGSEVNDVSNNFQRLSGGAKEADATLQTLRAGVKGTVDDLTLMTDANKVLLGGQKLTQDQWSTLAEGARVLAHAVGGDATDKLQELSTAMMTGRMRGEDLRALHADLASAEETYAAKLDLTKQQLTPLQKAEADRIAILDALKQRVKESGDQELTFKEQLEQAKASVTNVVNAVAAAVATSPVIKVAMDQIGAAFKGAFGGDQVALVQSITKVINQMAIYLVDLGLAGTSVATVMVAAWGLVKTAILGVMTVVIGIVDGIGKVVTAAETLAGKLHLVSPAEVAAVKDTQTQLDAMTLSMAKQTAEAAQMVIGTSDVNKSIDKVAGGLMTMRDGMIAASNSTASATSIQKQLASATDDTTESHAKLTSQQKTFAKVMEDLNSVGGNWRKTLDEIDGVVVEGAKYYLQNGVAAATVATAYGLTAVQIKAVEDSLNKAKNGQAEYDKILLLEASPALENFSNKLHDVGKWEPATLLTGLDKIYDEVHKLEDGALGIGTGILTMGHVAKPAIDDVTNGMTKLQKVVLDFETNVQHDLGNAVLGAIQGGGNVVQALGGSLGGDLGKSVTKELGSTLTAHLGSTLGGVVGSVLPGLGTLLGAGVGKLIDGLIGSIGGPSKDELAARASLKDFLGTFETKAGDQASAIQPLEDELTQVGYDAQTAQQMVAKLLDAKTPQAYAAALAQIKPAIDANLNTSNAVADAQKLVNAYTSAGHVMPQSLRDTLTALSQMKGLTTDEQTAIANMANAGKPNFESLKQEASDLGVSMAGLGPAFEQGDLEQKTTDLVGKIKDLTNAGGDLGGILAGSATKFGDLAEESIQYGTKLPESIKPYMQNLIDAGQLTDAAGDKITDMTKLQFEATPLQDGLDGVNSSIQHLADVLDSLPAKFGAVGAAASSLPTPGGGGGDGSGLPTYGPEVFVPSPRPAIIGTNGGEVVLHKATYDAMRSGGSGYNSAVVSELQRLNGQMMLLPQTIIRGQRDAALIANA